MSKLPTVGTSLRYRHPEYGSLACLATSDAYETDGDAYVDVVAFHPRTLQWEHLVAMPFRESCVWWPG